ncbi:MAG: YigZ family protein [Oscillospiraceae bacterium]|jgi:uncharacterized YigZ family protein|nr:YigZ family protein [Oscillospiraceae bacterium]
MDDSYRTILNAAESRLTVKKSEFIASVAPIKSHEEAAALNAEIRSVHRKARHNCYAYILRKNGDSRSSDDGEPSGTGGRPILEILRKESLCDVICVVTRYFGGILLGAAGLSRAYGKAAAAGVHAADIRVMKKSATLCIRSDYGQYDKTAALVRAHGGVVVSEAFADGVEMTADFPEENANVFMKHVGAAEIIRVGYRDFG